MQYIQIRSAIAEQIEQGMLSPGQKLPSERQLAETFHTTRVTLREALSLLEIDGLIYRADRRGWFIAQPRFQYPMATALHFRQLAAAQNRPHEVQCLDAKTMLASKEAGQHLELGAFAEVFQGRSLRLLEQRPICAVTYWVATQHLPAPLGTMDAQPEDVIRYLAAFVDLSQCQIEETLLVGGLSGEVATHLHATPGTPALLTTRKMRLAQRLLAVEVATWRHDVIEIISPSTDASRQFSVV